MTVQSPEEMAKLIQAIAEGLGISPGYLAVGLSESVLRHLPPEYRPSARMHREIGWKVYGPCA